MKWLRSRRTRWLTALALLAPVVAWLTYLLLLGNFYAAAPGVFRSAQPSAAQLTRYARQHQLRAVLNLRGAFPGHAWYDEELATSATLGLTHLDLRLSAIEEPSLAQLDELVDTLRRAPRPLLVHCQAGADRTGLAIALYRYAVLHQSADEARAGLNLAQGHFPWLWSKTDAMDRAFERYVSQRAPALGTPCAECSASSPSPSSLPSP